MRRLSVKLALTVALMIAVRSASAQPDVEFRVGTTGYRYFDVSGALESGIVLDALYVGWPDLHEIWLGAGYMFEPVSGFTLLPMPFAVFGTDGRGVTMGAWLYFERGEWQLRSYVGHFFPLAGEESSYTFADALDMTRWIGRWEVGASIDVFESEGYIDGLVGPTLKLHDDQGAWASSLRFGYATELRLTRTLEF